MKLFFLIGSYIIRAKTLTQSLFSCDFTFKFKIVSQQNRYQQVFAHNRSFTVQV